MHWTSKVTIALFLSGLSPLLAAQEAQDADAAERELTAVGSAISEIQSWLSDANETASAEEANLQQAAEELATLASALNTLELSIQQEQAELTKLQPSASALQEQKATQARTAANVIRAAYKQGTPNPLKSLLSQDTLGADARMRHYSKLISAQQLAKIEQFEATLKAIANNQEEVSSALSELNQQQQQLASTQNALTAAREEQTAALQTLRSSIRTRADELEQLEIDQAELQQLIEQIQRAMEGIRSFDDVPSFQAAKGKLPVPVAGSITSRFGQQYGNGSLTRQGLTLAVDSGTRVKAVHAGHVVFADWLRGSGLLVILDHGNGFMSLYGGNESLAATPGVWVDVGEVIATSGSPSNSDQPGLYFEIRERGQPQNPASWLDLQ